ncbi:MAG: phage/plasmid primase, P4 family [bacterium]|nr:phage/plasmid primase, P4 family [bacterium]
MSADDLLETIALSGDYRDRENAIREICSVPSLERETDLGNAQRFARLHGHRVRYVQAYKRWLVYNGTRWAIDTTGEIMRLARDVPPEIYKQAGACPTEADRKRLAQHGTRTESEKSLRAMLSLAQSEPGIAASPDDFDADPWALNAQNCVVDLRSGDTMTNHPNDMCSMVAGTVYDETQRSKLWEDCVERWLPDPEVREFVHRAVGYSLIGMTLEEVLFILWGSGANGKSRFVETLRAALGDYAKNTPAETLMASQKGSGGISNDVARLKGARFVSASESDENRRLNEAKVKALTGGDTITARFMWAEHFEFTPAFSVWLSTNHKPVITGQDLGIWRRIKLVPFNVTIPEQERDPKLAQKLHAELPSVLAWCVEGCVKYQLAGGLKAPQAVTGATEDYRQESDVFGEFLEDRCERSPSLFATSDALFRAYRDWADSAGERAMTKVAFGKKLTELGFEKAKVGGKRGREGLALRGE